MVLLWWLLWAVSSTSVAVQAELLTSTDCPSLRWAVYPARLDLFYFYLIEFDNTTTPDLPGIERAIASGLMDSFQGCNAYGEPVHGVQLNEQGHRYSSGVADPTGICSATTPGDECRVIRGLTSIFLDTSADGVADAAYAVMKQVLDDLPIVDEFLATPLKRAKFIRPIGENLVLHPANNDDNRTNDDDSGSTSGVVVTIAVIAAVTAFVLTALLFLGLSRSQNRKAEEKVNMRLAYYHAKRRKFWSQLQEDEDQRTYPGLMMTEPAPMQTVTWSVSDLTSESASIKSALKMDRIDEEYEGGSNESRADEAEEGTFEEHYEEVKEDDHEAAPLARPSLEIPPFIAHWQDDHSELATSGSNLPDRVWELATMPKSYWDESDPEAPTPDHSPAANFSSPTGCVYLQYTYGEENSFADNELDFSMDSPCKLPTVTYTTEEEEYSQSSSSPDGTRRQSEQTNSLGGSLMLRPLESFDRSDENPAESERESLDVPKKAQTKNIVMTYRYKKEENMIKDDEQNPTSLEDTTLKRPKPKDPDPIMTYLKVDCAVSGEETDDNSPSSKDVTSDDSIEEGNDSESIDEESCRSGGTNKAEVFYTPKQDSSTGNDSLKTVAQTIVREAHIYDDATQKWARQVLENMQSPQLKLLAASPHYQ